MDADRASRPRRDHLGVARRARCLGVLRGASRDRALARRAGLWTWRLGRRCRGAAPDDAQFGPCLHRADEAADHRARPDGRGHGRDSRLVVRRDSERGEQPQMIAPRARWRSASIRPGGSGPAPQPMSAWIRFRSPARTASRTSVGWSRCVRHAAFATATTMSPTTIAAHRWRTCAVVMSDVSAGKRDPSSAASRRTRARRSPRSHATRTSAARTSRPRRTTRAGEALAPAAARDVSRVAARTSRYTSSPTSSIAAARRAVTDSPLFPSRTVSRPSQAWNPTSPTAAIEGPDRPLISMVEERGPPTRVSRSRPRPRSVR